MKAVSQFDLLCSKLTGLVVLVVFFLVVPSKVIESGSLVKTLPGLIDDISIIFETGYIGVGEANDVQLFYYFVESEENPENKPLMFMLSGGPGCSGLTKILANTGPYIFNYSNSTLENPVLETNPYSWTKVANIVAIDHPAGTGFSYAKTPEAYITNDTLASKHAYQFLKKWLVEHPTFINNELYVFGDSYGGLWVPMIVQEIYNGNKREEEPHIKIKGYVLGNTVADTSDEYNTRIPFAHLVALLSDAIYKSTKENCYGEYLKIDPNNNPCMHDLHVVDKCLERINLQHVLEPYCDTSINLKSALLGRGLSSIEKTSMDFWSLPYIQMQRCQDNKTMYATAWANRRDVQEALHIHEEFNGNEWVGCNESLRFYYDKEPISYTHNVLSNVDYHQHLTNKHCRALIYSGDHDMTVPYLSSLNWIELLSLLVINDWRPWFVDDQVAGYIMKYSNYNYNLTFATVKGGGHIAPDYKPKECLKMLIRWLDDDVV